MTNTTTEDLGAQVQETKQTVEQRREDLRLAEGRLRSLSEEASALPGKLHEALGQAAQERAQAARKGESAAHVPADLDVEALHRRKEEVRLELWAQRIAVEQVRLDLLDAEEQRDQAAYDEAQAELAAIEPRFEQIRKEYEAIKGRANVDPWNSHRTAVKKEVKERLQQLEESYPGGLDA